MKGRSAQPVQVRPKAVSVRLRSHPGDGEGDQAVEAPGTDKRVLYVKAKQEPTRRFHFLYDKVWRADILAHAYALARANGGVPGVDGETFGHIDECGVERWLDELREEIRTGGHKAQPVRRVMIPKSHGGLERAA